MNTCIMLMRRKVIAKEKRGFALCLGQTGSLGTSTAHRLIDGVVITHA